jgi:adenosylcobinamide-GDP ribazoletransferase
LENDQPFVHEVKMKMQINRFLTALSFLTIFPNINGKKKEQPIKARELGKSAAYFPLVGLFIGLVLYLLMQLLGLLDLSTFTKAVLLVSGLVLISGGLHIDGLADTFDGLASGWNRQRSLEIMKQGGIGPFGIAAVVLMLLLKVSTVISLLGSSNIVWVFIAPVLARWSMVLSMTFQPPARKDGLGKIFIENCTTKELLTASIIMMTVLLLSIKAKSILLIAAAALTAYLFNRLIKRKLDGITGDTLGALCEIVEIVILLMLIAVKSW